MENLEKLGKKKPTKYCQLENHDLVRRSAKGRQYNIERYILYTFTNCDKTTRLRILIIAQIITLGIRAPLKIPQQFP